MQTTTTSVLHDRFVSTILGVTPTPAGVLSGLSWSYVPSPRKNGRTILPAGFRNFDLTWRDTRPTFLSVGGRGVDYSSTLAMTVSYADIDPEQRQHIIVQDAVDLRRALRRLINVEPGLTDVTYVGERNERDSQSNYLTELVWTIRYHQRTV